MLEVVLSTSTGVVSYSGVIAVMCQNTKLDNCLQLIEGDALLKTMVDLTGHVVIFTKGSCSTIAPGTVKIFSARKKGD